ncbi:MAG: hypothetical protein ACOCP4_02555, partial [Candidatus Woesearchaeota archaeon]
MIFFIGIMRIHCLPSSTLLFQFLSHFLPIQDAALFIFSATGATHKKELPIHTLRVPAKTFLFFIKNFKA